MHLADRLGAGTTVVELKRLAGGASREMWLVVVERTDGSRERLVLRRDPPGSVIESSREAESSLLVLAHEAGVPVPVVRWAEADPTVLGSPFFMMEFVEGEAIVRRLFRDDAYAVARERLPEQLATALARIHTIDTVRPEIAFLARPDEDVPSALVELHRYRDILRQIAPDPHPVFELAIRWLAERAPAPVPHGVVHGDFRMGNVLVDHEGLRAVLDWELAHVGDPREDLGWFCVRAWRFGNDDEPAGGLCDRERFVAAYERASGSDVDRAAVHWWEVFGALKWGIICVMQAATFLGGVPNVELASLGRRTAEMELELLDLMEAT